MTEFCFKTYLPEAREATRNLLPLPNEEKKCVQNFRWPFLNPIMLIFGSFKSDYYYEMLESMLFNLKKYKEHLKV